VTGGTTVGEKAWFNRPDLAGRQARQIWEDVMEINIIGRNLGITDRFRDYANEKAE